MCLYAKVELQPTPKAHVPQIRSKSRIEFPKSIDPDSLTLQLDSNSANNGLKPSTYFEHIIPKLLCFAVTPFDQGTLKNLLTSSYNLLFH